MKLKSNFKIIILAGTIALSSCGMVEQIKSYSQPKTEVPVYTAVVEKPSYPVIRTPRGANQLDLETPLRCFVNWETQQMISSVPYNLKAFNLVRNGKMICCRALRSTVFLLKQCLLKKHCLS